MDKQNAASCQAGVVTRSGAQSFRNNSLEVYQAFMTGYVRRINEATLNVTIGGIRIGSAKYSRLAQINLKTRIITFSRYAIENVPERGRRYLVIHELAHVKEASHNKQFWKIVERYEPNYRQIGREIQLAFGRNVKEDHLARRNLKMPNTIETPKLILSPGLLLERLNDDISSLSVVANTATDQSETIDNYCCGEDEQEENTPGIIYGGAESLPEDKPRRGVAATPLQEVFQLLLNL